MELFRDPFEVFHDQPAEGRLDVPVRKVEQKRRNEENDRKTVVLRRQLGTAGKNLALHLEQAVDDRRRRKRRTARSRRTNSERSSNRFGHLRFLC